MGFIKKDESVVQPTAPELSSDASEVQPVAVSEEIVVARSVTKADIVELYNSGKNVYQIALEVFGFDDEKQLDLVRQTLGIE